MTVRRLVPLVTALALLVAPAAAEACSCLPVDPRTALQEADAAVVGVVESRVVSAPGDSLAPTAIRIRVERAIKGLEGPTVDVVSAADSASCGISAGVGARVGLLLDRQGDGLLHAFACWQLAPDDLLEAAGPLPPPDGSGAPALLAGVRVGANRTVVLDRLGRVLGWGSGAGRLVALGACPGGRFAVEAVVGDGRGWIAVRDLRRFGARRVVSLARTQTSVLAVDCANPTAGRIHVAFGRNDGKVGMLRVLAGKPRLLLAAAGDMAAFSPGQVVVADSQAGTVDAIALADGFRNRVGRSADGVASLAVAPDGRHVAIVHGGLGSASSRFTVFGVWGSRTTDLDRQLATTPGGIAFAGDDQLVVLTPPNQGAHVLRPATGKAIGDLVGGFGTRCVATARAIFDVEYGGDLRIGRLPGGPSRTVELPGPVTEITALATV